MKTLLTTTAALSIGLTLGVSQPIQAAAPIGQGVFTAKKCSSVHFAAVRSERKAQDTREFERTQRDEIEKLERDQMRLQQLESTEQTDLQQLERNREREIERERRAAQQSESHGPAAPGPTSEHSVVPDYDPAKVKEQAAEQGRDLTPEEAQQIQEYEAQRGSRGESGAQLVDPALGNSGVPDYDPEKEKQQAIERGDLQ